MTGERMRAFDDPVDLIVYMLEKARSIALLKTLEDLSDVVFSDHWFLLYIRQQPVRWMSSSDVLNVFHNARKMTRRTFLSSHRSLTMVIQKMNGGI
jgi:hypothetical protein